MKQKVASREREIERKRVVAGVCVSKGIGTIFRLGRSSCVWKTFLVVVVVFFVCTVTLYTRIFLLQYRFSSLASLSYSIPCRTFLLPFGWAFSLRGTVGFSFSAQNFPSAVVAHSFFFHPCIGLGTGQQKLHSACFPIRKRCGARPWL